MKNEKLLFTGYEWDVSLIEKIWPIIDKIGKEDLGLDYHQPQFDIVTSEQMIDAYSSVGMPIFYNHWSFGKTSAKYLRDYKNGEMGLAYEMVINSNPCLAYLMEDNTAMMTALVIAHANVGHASVFKMNYLFKQHTDPDSILNFLEYAKRYISKCEEIYGPREVETLLDHLHILAKFGADKYTHKPEESEDSKQKRELRLLESEEQNYNREMATVPRSKIKSDMKDFVDRIEDILAKHHNVIRMQEENLLRVIEKYSLIMTPWQKEIVRIMRKIEQYFFPQRQTKVINEGWACFCHYYIMTKLLDEGYIDEGAYLEFLQSHTSVCYQPDMGHLNPYALGFEMFMDLKRACENPDEEDYKYLPTIAGKDWRTELRNIVKYYKDESFVLQFLSPKVMRKMKLFILNNDSKSDYYMVTGIHDDEDIESIRRACSGQLELDNYLPSVEVREVDLLNNRIKIKIKEYKERNLSDASYLFLDRILEGLTGFDIKFI